MKKIILTITIAVFGLTASAQSNNGFSKPYKEMIRDIHRQVEAGELTYEEAEQKLEEVKEAARKELEAKLAGFSDTHKEAEVQAQIDTSRIADEKAKSKGSWIDRLEASLENMENRLDSAEKKVEIKISSKKREKKFRTLGTAGFGFSWLLDNVDGFYAAENQRFFNASGHLGLRI
jgi:polyhydroxyalkanoate synthesis regulator phasin